MNNNTDMTKLMNILSTMKKEDLEKSISQLEHMLGPNDKQNIINTLKKNMNK